MNPRSLFVLLALLAAGAPAFGGIVDLLIPPADLETFVVTDFTEEGRRLRLPTPDKPVYYTAVSAGFHDFGGYKGGERPIDRKLVNRTLLNVLAKQGYLPARKGQSPDIILVWTWGTMNAKFIPAMGGELRLQVNQGQLIRFLGGEKLGLGSRSSGFPELELSPGLAIQGSDAEYLKLTASDDLYVAAVAAYDVKLAKPGRATLLWNTRISAPSRGFWLPDAFPAMMAIATPLIGRETDKPVCIRASEHFKPNVKVGDPKVVSYLEETASSVNDIGLSK